MLNNAIQIQKLFHTYIAVLSKAWANKDDWSVSLLERKFCCSRLVVIRLER